MTEAEWLTANDTDEMLRTVRARSKRRKSRLFAVACCRAITPELPDPRSQRAIEVAELHADGLVGDEVLFDARRGAEAVVQERYKGPDHIVWVPAAYAGSAGIGSDDMWQYVYRRGMECAAVRVTTPHPYQAAVQVGGLVHMSLTPHRGPGALAQADIIRDIFGNPFRPVSFNPEWRTDTARALAQQMYDSRDFSAMSSLADVLQDAGCDNEDILNHCRGPGPHVRGCWVVDLVLGKE